MDSLVHDKKESIMDSLFSSANFCTNDTHDDFNGVKSIKFSLESLQVIDNLESCKVGTDSSNDANEDLVSKLASLVDETSATRHFSTNSNKGNFVGIRERSRIEFELYRDNPAPTPIYASNKDAQNLPADTNDEPQSITHAFLLKTQTQTWKIRLSDDAEISAYDYKDGYLVAVAGKHRTVCPLKKELVEHFDATSIELWLTIMNAMCRIDYNESKSISRNHVFLDPYVIENYIDEGYDPHPAAEALMDLDLCINWAIRRGADPECFEYLKEYIFERLDYRTLGARHKVSHATARNRVNTALAYLREFLQL
jgi:hypothetical protein